MFHKLSADELNQKFSKYFMSSALGTISFENSFEEQIFVNVVLIGFDGEMSIGLKTNKKEMESLLGDMTQQLTTLEGESFRVVSRIRFIVKMAHTSIGSRIRQTIAEEIGDKTTFTLIPVEKVQSLIEKEYMQLRSSSPCIFIVNAGRHSAGYAYGTGGKCHTAHFCGDKKKFLWLDINAGPVEFGPVSSGDGGVGRDVLPFVDDVRMFEDQAEVRNMLVEVARFVGTTCKMLFMSTPSRLPVSSNVSEVMLKFIHLSESDKGLEVLRVQKEDVCNALNRVVFGIRCDEEVETIKLSACPGCVAAIQHSLKYHRASARTVGHHAYLDSRELHHWTRQFLPQWRQSAASAHVYPVVMIDTHKQHHSKHVVLLDRIHQANAFHDMVIGLISEKIQVQHDFFCNGDARVKAVLNPSNSSRAVLGAILKGLFGVNPTHVLYDSLHNRITTNYLWSVSHTPFGLFSDSLFDTCFFVRELIYRNAIRSRMIQHSREVEKIPSSFTSEVEALVNFEEGKVLKQRWNLWKWKKDELEHELALSNYHHVDLYLKSMKYDIDAIFHIFEEVSHRVERSFECEDSSKPKSGSWKVLDYTATMTVILSFAISGLMVWRMGKSVFGKKKKRRYDTLPRNIQQEFLED